MVVERHTWGRKDVDRGAKITTQVFLGMKGWFYSPRRRYEKNTRKKHQSELTKLYVMQWVGGHGTAKGDVSRTVRWI
jgi:hypothetical protein